MNEAWESLGRAADLQKRLDTIGRRMVPGSLAGSTETASLPSPLPPVVNAGAVAVSQPERHVFHHRGVLTVSDSDDDPIGRAAANMRVQAALRVAPSADVDVDIVIAGSVAASFTIPSSSTSYDGTFALGTPTAENDGLHTSITDAGASASGLVVAVTLT